MHPGKQQEVFGSASTKLTTKRKLLEARDLVRTNNARLRGQIGHHSTNSDVVRHNKDLHPSTTNEIHFSQRVSDKNLKPITLVTRDEHNGSDLHID